MSKNIQGAGGRAEFDGFADQYRDMHVENIAITGEHPEYFHEYKISDLRRAVDQAGVDPRNIFDFGSGIGNSIPYFRKYFPDSTLTCGDVSERSLALSKEKCPGAEQYSVIGDVIDLPSESQDVVFTACVLHHIPHSEHHHWLSELRRITKPGGILAIYEHNPFNPLTVRAVNTCPLDVNAHLIAGPAMKSRARAAGWQTATIAYKVFFPAALSGMRWAEPHLEWLPFGGQYRLVAQ